MISLDFSSLGLAWRNTFRNRKRTLATISAVMFSCAGLLLFSGYVTWAHRAGESHAIIQTGHLQIFRDGFYERGAGNPTAFAIDGFSQLRTRLLADEKLRSKIQLITGQLIINGLASSAGSETSAPFLGIGVFPKEDRELIEWNPYGIYEPRKLKINESILQEGPEWEPGDLNACSLGVGIASILQVSMDSVENAEQRPVAPPAIDVPGLSAEFPQPDKSTTESRPTIELLSLPPSAGTPNMTSLSVSSILARPTKGLDDRLVKLPIGQASSLVFPGEETKVTSLIVLLRRTSDLPFVQNRINQFIAKNQLPLETKSWTELTPEYRYSMAMLDMFFLFTMCVVSVVLLFTIFNTVHMGITERIGEIGTTRAMGLSGKGVIDGFLLEGIILGTLGASAGVLLGLLVAAIINRIEIVYHPPIVPYFAKLEIFVWQNPAALLWSFFGCLIVSVVSSYPAASKAARMNISDTLRHR